MWPAISSPDGESIDAVAFVLGLLLTYVAPIGVLKNFFLLPRPPGAGEPPTVAWVPAVFQGVLASIATGEGPRFPSGHACAQISEQLGTASDKLASVIVPLLSIEYATHIHECHQLESAYDEGEHEQLHSTLDALTADLKNLDIARQYFTTAFMKEELAKLSRSCMSVCWLFPSQSRYSPNLPPIPPRLPLCRRYSSSHS